MPVNSQNPSFNSLFGSSNNVSGEGLNTFIPVRVMEVSIRPSDQDNSLYQVSDSEFGIGAIKFEPLSRGSSISDNQFGNIAFPLDINYRKLPVKNEIVFVILGPSLERVTEGNSDAFIYYYTNSINVWNSIHLNPLPSQATQGNNSTDTNSRNTVEDGIPNNPGNFKLGPKYGDIFEENQDIRNLYPQEGDIIFEGRFGNSLRFSSTARQSLDFLDIQSPWSSMGKDGDPITILKNGQGQDVSFDNWIPQYEDINNNDSSIYLTSTQNIPIEVAYPNLSSYGLDVTPPEDTTAELEKELRAEGNEFTSNNEADSLNQVTDSVNVEPDLSTDPNRRQPLFPGIESPSLDSSLGDIPSFEFPNTDDELDENQEFTTEEEDGRPLTAAERKRRNRGYDNQNNNIRTAAQRKRDRRSKNKTNSGSSGRESFAERKRRLRGGG